MTHEFKKILEAYAKYSSEYKTVLATVVAIEGSSYRRPGVRMLLFENQHIVGAVSGGCVEKEVIRQAQTVFKNGKPKIMTYDGRYRLGCEGVMYILLEEFSLNDSEITKIQQTLKARNTFELHSFFYKTECERWMGTSIQFEDNDRFSFANQTTVSKNTEHPNLVCFEEKLAPCFRLILIGTEHDAVKLCELASNTGWEVIIVGSPNNPKQKKDFPEVDQIINSSPEEFTVSNLDSETAIVLMTHNYAKDLLYLKALKNSLPAYIGLLGPAKRREKLLSDFIEDNLDIPSEFLEIIYGPAGLNIGAETPQEIAISIIAEILSVIRNQTTIHLQDKIGSIHSNQQP